MAEIIEVNEKKFKNAGIAKAICIYSLSIALILAAVILKFSLIIKIESNNIILTYLALSLVVVGIGATQLVYLLASRYNLVYKPKGFAAFSAAVTIAFISCLYLELYSIWAMPVCLAAFVISPLSRRRDAFMGNLFTNIMLVFVLIAQHILSFNGDIFPTVAMFCVGVFSGSLTAYWVSNDTKRINFILKSLAIVLIAVVFAFVIYTIFSDDFSRFLSILPYLGIGMLGQVVLAQLLQPMFEAVFNLLTNMRLVEFTDRNAPLIKRLTSEAPGTFNHSLAVANFAEMCAVAIGENPYLARACAYYHDIGKLINPQYYKENQSGSNPHDDLLPEVSADIIRAHTTEGLRLCKEYRIPSEIADVTMQHHGTLPIYLFYSKAQKLTDGIVNLEDYCYRGIRPVTTVAAIIMLCDTGEAAIRGLVNPDSEQVDKLLKKLINDRIVAGQFDNCDISLRDLEKIRQTIYRAYGGQFHKRLQYPDGK